MNLRNHKHSKKPKTHIAPRGQAPAGKRTFSQRAAAWFRRLRVRVTRSFAKAKPKIASFFAEVRKGSPRAIGVLGAAVVLLVVLPLMLILLPGKDKQPTEADLPAVVLAEEGNMQLDAYAMGASNYAGDTIAPTPSPTPEPEVDPREGGILKKGMTSPVVALIQEQLMDLGYMDSDEPTEYFGPATKDAVELFQRQHAELGLTRDGCVGAQTFEALFSEQATSYVVTVGVKDTDVREIQVRLRALGYLDTKPTEYFGTDTEDAVKLFQTRNGLSADGMVGAQTRELLYSEDAKANYLERGAVSERVRSAQKRLAKLGYYTGEADGKYGTGTEDAMRIFQQNHGLIADGYLGPQTEELLNSSSAQPYAIIFGMSGSNVKKVQTRLKELNYMSSKDVDGYFGSGTEAAVRSFQNRNSLSVDGKVGAKTLAALNSSSAKKASSSSSSSGSSSGSSSSGSSSTDNSSSGSSSSGSSSSSSGSVSKGASVDAFIAAAQSKLGARYKKAGKGPDTFDCSGFVYWCLKQAGVNQSYMTSSAWQKTTKYKRISSMSDLKRGDVVSFKGHVGIYLGSGQMIDASSTQGKVRVTTGHMKDSSYWTKNFVCGYRIF
ncbi:peptidoglycan-binding protein [Christensenellaceae bacterium OttesenSCG-928-L17]|nr:peptidoglycan-binding protein [Christensenellaceae bacterium OttesenSCG-928-L17]